MLFTSTNLFTEVHRMQAVNENTYIQISISKKWHSAVLKRISNNIQVFTCKVKFIKHFKQCKVTWFEMTQTYQQSPNIITIFYNHIRIRFNCLTKLVEVVEWGGEKPILHSQLSIAQLDITILIQFFYIYISIGKLIIEILVKS